MKAKLYVAMTLSLGCLGASAGAAVIYQTGFEGGTGSPAYFTLPGGGYYLPYYGDGTVGDLNGGYDASQSGTLGDNWAVLPTNEQTGIDLVSTWGGVPPPTGQWIDLIGTSGPGGIQRTFTVQTGVTYTLKWTDFSNLGGDPAVNGGSVYEVAFGSLDQLVMAQNAWTGKSLSFTAAADGNATLRFFSKDGGNGNTGIDNVEIDAVTEPFTLILGASALALGIRRRARKS